MKKAFEGGLVEQNTEDEPASKLLERMKEDKGKDMPKARYAKRKSRRDDIIIEKKRKMNNPTPKGWHITARTTMCHPLGVCTAAVIDFL